MDGKLPRQFSFNKANSNKKHSNAPSIIYRLFLMFKFEILGATAVKVLADVSQFSNPFLLK
jgi:hypothetical protein